MHAHLLGHSIQALTMDALAVVTAEALFRRLGFGFLRWLLPPIRKLVTAPIFWQIVLGSITSSALTLTGSWLLGGHAPAWIV